MIRDQPRAFWLALLAFLLMVGSLAIFFIWTYPANQATSNWTVAPIVLLTRTRCGQTLRIREASTRAKEVAELCALLLVSDHVVKPLSSWTDPPPSDQKTAKLSIYEDSGR